MKKRSAQKAKNTGTLAAQQNHGASASTRQVGGSDAKKRKPQPDLEVDRKQSPPGQSHIQYKNLKCTNNRQRKLQNCGVDERSLPETPRTTSSDCGIYWMVKNSHRFGASPPRHLDTTKRRTALQHRL